MGIIGLTSFMNNSILDNVLKDLKLSDCKLLIDGYSLLFKINNGIHCLQSTHGGNYNELAAKLDNLFKTFQKCQIAPIFLFDGGKALDDRKFQTSLKRAKSKINDSSHLNNINPNPSKKKPSNKISLELLVNTGQFKLFNNLLPILAYKVFFKFVQKYAFTAYQCYFEADYDLVLLANEVLKCPLLSSDSDFFVYDLKYGYIPIDYFDIHPELDFETVFYLPARIYKLENFIEYYNTSICDYENVSLQKELLPVFAVLCGNDYVDRSVFSSLLATFDTTNNNCKRKRRWKFSAAYARSKNAYFYRLLDWLVQFSDVKDCLSTILKFVKVDKRELIEKVVLDSVQEYMCLKPFESKFLYDRFMELDNSSRKSEDIFASDGSILTESFLQNYQECKFGRLCLDVLLHRRVIFNCQIEVLNWPSTYLSSAHIRKLFYSVLFNDYTKSNEDKSASNVVKEYLRVDNQIKIYDVELDSAASVNQLKQESFLLKNVFHLSDSLSDRISKMTHLGPKLKNFFLMLNFWITNQSGEKNNENYKRAFIVCLMKFTIIEPVYSLINSNVSNSSTTSHSSINKLKFYEESSDSSHLFNAYQNHNSNEFINEFTGMFSTDSENVEYLKELKTKLTASFCPSLVEPHATSGKSDKYLNLRVLHGISEYQSIYMSLSYLFEVVFVGESKLLDLDEFFNGSFLHNFIEELQHRVNPSLYIEELLGRRSFFKWLYYELSKFYDEMFADVCSSDSIVIDAEMPMEVSISTINNNSVQASVQDKTKTKNYKKNLRKKLKRLEEKNSSSLASLAI
jgi:hypothetical protein